jgi:DNA repair protein RecN (Recombination protein N)
MATVGELAERVGPLVDLHGQHEHQALLAPSSHVHYLDRWAGAPVAEALEAYREARRAYRDAAEAVGELEEQIAKASADSDYVAFVVQEIERIDPQPGEDDALRVRLPALQNAGRLSDAASQATAMLRGDGGVLDRLGSTLHELQKHGGIDPALDEIGGRLEEVYTLVDDVSASAREYRDAVQHDPGALERAMERLSALSGLTKKYGPTLDDVLQRHASALTALEAVSDDGATLQRAQRDADAALDTLRERARTLQELRETTVPGFLGALEAATAELAMAGARFEVEFTTLDTGAWTDDGPAKVTFLYAPASGQPPRPLSKIASGGEISRVMLALKSVLGSADRVETLVFDEVDAGVGGATATAVGARLKELAATHQVIVVTHLAQVAAFADAQLVVSKMDDDGGGGVLTRVVEVSEEDRVAEIARMLSGNDSEASLVHARELLASSAKGQ